MKRFSEREAIRAELTLLNAQTLEMVRAFERVKSLNDARRDALILRLRELDRLEREEEDKHDNSGKAEKLTGKIEDYVPLDPEIEEALEEEKALYRNSVSFEPYDSVIRGGSRHIPLDFVAKEVENVILGNGSPVPLKDIQTHIELVFNKKWQNYSGLMNNIMRRHHHIKRSEPTGFYTLDELEENN